MWLQCVLCDTSTLNCPSFLSLNSLFGVKNKGFKNSQNIFKMSYFKVQIYQEVRDFPFSVEFIKKPILYNCINFQNENKGI